MKKFIGCLAVAVLLVGLVQAAPPKAERMTADPVVPGTRTQYQGGATIGIESTDFEASDGWVARVPGGFDGFFCGPEFFNCEGPNSIPVCAGDANSGGCCVDNPNKATLWFQSISAMACHEPHIDTVNPYSGEQHMRWVSEQTDKLNCTGFTGPCRLSTFSPDQGPMPLTPSTLSGYFAISALFGMDLEFSPQASSYGLISARMRFWYDGTIQVLDNGYGYIYPGSWVVGPYMEARMEKDPCNNTLCYYYGGAQFWCDSTGNAFAPVMEQYVMLGDNYSGAAIDTDHIYLTRGRPCPTECGNGIIEPGEECEEGVNADLCSVECVAPNGGTCEAGFCVGGPNDTLPCIDNADCDDPDDCMCIRVHDNIDDPQPVPQGTTVEPNHGGWFVYEGETPATAIDLCGTTGLDTFLMVYWLDEVNMMLWFLRYNDDCAPWDPYGMADPLASCYYPAISDIWYESCVCGPTTQHDFYYIQTDYFGEMPPEGVTTLNISKRLTCGEIWENGACCDVRDGSCVDDVPEAQCVDYYQRWTPQKECAKVCEPWLGSCCDHETGACTDDVPYDQCVGDQLDWDHKNDCASVDCWIHTGACCDHETGVCVNDVLEDDCQCAQCEWAAKTDCAQVDCFIHTGACCDNVTGACTDDVLPDACAGSNQTWYKDDTCATVTCTLAMGACCDTNLGQCTQMTMPDCMALEKSDWYKGMACGEIECLAWFTPIPTVSGWGMAILALLLLVGAKVYFSRRAAIA